MHSFPPIITTLISFTSHGSRTKRISRCPRYFWQPSIPSSPGKTLHKERLTALHAICVQCFLYAAFPKNCLSDDSSTTGKQLGIFEKRRIKSIPLALFCVFPLLFQELALTNYRIPHIYLLVKPFSGFSARIQVNIM